MERRFTQAKKARRQAAPPNWNFVYNAPVWLRRQHGIYGSDHILYDHLHGLMGGSAAALPVTKTETPVEKPKSLWRRFLDFIHRIFHRSED